MLMSKSFGSNGGSSRKQFVKRIPLYFACDKFAAIVGCGVIALVRVTPAHTNRLRSSHLEWFLDGDLAIDAVLSNDREFFSRAWSTR